MQAATLKTGQRAKSKAASVSVSRPGGGEHESIGISDNRPEAAVQRGIQLMANQFAASNRSFVPQVIPRVPHPSPVQAKKPVGVPPSSPVIQRVLQDTDIPPLILPASALYRNLPGGIPDLVTQEFAAVNADTPENMILRSSVERVLAAFALLDPRVQSAIGHQAEMGAALVGLSMKIWGRREFADKIIDHLTRIDLNEVHLAEAVKQLPPYLPPLTWDTSGFAGTDAIDTAGKKASLPEAQQGLVNPVDRLRAEQAFQRYHPAGNLQVSPLPRRAPLGTNIKEDVTVYSFIPDDTSQMQEPMKSKVEEQQERMKQEFKTDLKKGDYVTVGVDQPHPAYYMITHNSQPCCVPRDKMEVPAEPQQGPLGGGEQVPLFANDTPSPDDVGQQALGDCFLLAPLASIANQNPNYIKEMVKDTGGGTYAVRFFNRNTTGNYEPVYQPKWIKVNDTVYVDGDGQPIYAKGNKALWPGIVEKAYAVFMKSFQATSGDDPANALERIMGTPSSSVAPGGGAAEGALGSKKYSGQAIILFKRIRETLQKGGLVTYGTEAWGEGGTGISGGENTSLHPGMASTHAYSVFGVKGDPDTKDALYVTIRNPWGRMGRKYESNFKLSGFSSGWKTEASEQENPVFDLELSDLMRFANRIAFN